jgi:DNA-binding CsgD family transcriptional regulator/pimeloyl-ACP methyl ester carboxylesterase
MADGVRFCTSRDGTAIGYSSSGAGKPLVILPGWWMSPEADRRRIIGRDFWSDLPRGRRCITYDLRGIGVSGREVTDVGIDRQVEDLEAVADANGLDSFAIWSFLDQCATAIAFAARFPARVERLALYNPWAFVPQMVAREHIRLWSTIIRADWGFASRCFAELLYPKGPIEAQEASTKSIRETQSPDVALLYLENNNSLDVRHGLAGVTAPTLVIAREGPGRTRLVPTETVQRVAAGIRGSRLVVYDAAAAVCPYFEYQTYQAMVRDFLADAPPALPTPAPLSGREVEVLRWAARGRTNAEIAEELVISRHTADRHMSNIFSKIGASNRAEAVLYAARFGLLADE